MNRGLRYSLFVPVCMLAILFAAPLLRGQVVVPASAPPDSVTLPNASLRSTGGGNGSPAWLEGDPDVAESSLMLSLGVGYARYVAPYESPIAIDRDGTGFSVAVEWHPGVRLRMAIESGWTTFYSYELTDVETSFGRTDASLSLSAIPLLVVFSMPVAGDFVLHAGTGGYFVRSHATSFSETVDVVRFAQGWMAAASWDHAVAGDFRLGASLKWYGATEFEDASLLLQLRVVIPVVVW